MLESEDVGCCLPHDPIDDRESRIQSLRMSGHALKRGQAVGVRKAELVDLGCAVQDVDGLVDDGQMVGYGASLSDDVVVDNDGSRLPRDQAVGLYGDSEVWSAVGPFPWQHDRQSRRRRAASFPQRGAQPIGARPCVPARHRPGQGPEGTCSCLRRCARATAEFNRNLLRRLYRELGADFDLDALEHLALWNEAESRIEMHLCAKGRHRVVIPGASSEVGFEDGESVRTEISVKFTRVPVEAAFDEVGLSMESWLTDARGRFALALAKPLDDSVR